MGELQFSPASVRNSAPLLGVLRHEFENVTSVFEIGSGTGQHAVLFSSKLPQLTWQTSDLEENHAQICAHIENAALENVLTPILFDARNGFVPAKSYDAVFSCNTAHIMSWDAVTGMIAFVGMALEPGGLFCYYGPFSNGGRFNTDSNRSFDESLRAQDASMGIRDLVEVDKLAIAAGLSRQRLYAMPANNFFVVWRMQEERTT